MKTFSRHKLNFFERITDPMRFSKGSVPPEKLFSFIVHFAKQIKSTIFLLFILQLLTVIIDLSLPLVFGLIINEILETENIALMIKDNLLFMISYASLFLFLRELQIQCDLARVACLLKNYSVLLSILQNKLNLQYFYYLFSSCLL